jgi:hypothetical protein
VREDLRVREDLNANAIQRVGKDLPILLGQRAGKNRPILLEMVREDPILHVREDLNENHILIAKANANLIRRALVRAILENPIHRALILSDLSNLDRHRILSSSAHSLLKLGKERDVLLLAIRPLKSPRCPGGHVQRKLTRVKRA